MTYYTNHCWCSTSNWDGKSFNGEASVDFSDSVGTDSLCLYKHKIPDPDFERLTQKKPFFDKEEVLEKMERVKERRSARNEEFDEEEYLKDEMEFCRKKTVELKPEVAEWLNANVRDVAVDKEDENTIASRKGWATGNDIYNANQNWRICVFFARQVDALKFIRKFSIYKDPTFYFDYFSDDRREMESSKIISIINENANMQLNIRDYSLVRDRKEETSTNLDYLTFRLLDWEKNNEEDCDDIEMTPEEIKKAIEEIDSVLSQGPLFDASGSTIELKELDIVADYRL
jgi:hypothetical protein